MRYPFSPELLDALPEPLAELFRELEAKLLDEICSRLRIADQLNEVTVQDIRALRARGIELQDIERAIRETAGVSEAKLTELFDDVVQRNRAYYGELAGLTQITAPDSFLTAVDVAALLRQTKEECSNITRSMGFLVNNGRTMLPPARAYQWALDSAELQIQSGAISYNTAIQSAVKQLADSGLRTVPYASGHVDQVDVAVRRAVMTGVNQLCQKYAEQSVDYLETDLVEVTAHRGARDTGFGTENHKAWQGKVYRWSQKPGNSTGEYEDFVDVTGYGTGHGLGGWNCRHHYYPFVEGISERTYTDRELERIDPQPIAYQGREYTMYEATQKQRQIERTVRKLKRRKAALSAAGQYAAADAAGARLQALNREYKAFSEAANLPLQKARMKVLYT